MKQNLLLVLVIFLLSLTAGIGQQVYPVRVQGTMLPPHSLVLSDYAGDKAQDLFFIMTLEDPVEPLRMVKFRLTVLQDGNEIMFTDPNFNPPPVTLERLNPLTVDGIDLAPYFDTRNMVSVRGGRPTGLLPEGFNSFCLEVIDVIRGVPISDRICVQGIFELAQPPILELPICHEKIQKELLPNLTFRWLPMHQLSLNTPVDVQYEFTLVKLLPGIQNPNDGFNYAQPVLQRLLYQPILQYLDDEPLLEPGYTYAWRVQAVDGRGYELFKNNGYSEICTFTVIDGPDGPGGPPDGGPGDFSCAGGECIFSGELSNAPLETPLQNGDEVKIGHFNLVFTNVQPAGPGAYTGEGSIFLSFLFSKVKVRFSNLQVNTDRRVYAGQAVSIVENPDVVPPLFSADNAGRIERAASDLVTGFADATAQAMEDYFNNGQNTLISQLKRRAVASAPALPLPLGIDKEIPGGTGRMVVAVTGLNFQPDRAWMNAVLSTRLNAGGPWIKFGVKGMCLQPMGPAISNPTLELLSDVPLDGLGLPLTIMGLASGDDATSLAFDCNGFEMFNLKGQYTFDNQLVYPQADPAENLKVTFTATTRRLNDFIAKVDALEPFVVKGAEGFTFKVGEMWLDYSRSANPTNIQFPEDYPTEKQGAGFQGFYLSQAGVDLPEVFNSTISNGAVASLGVENLLFDSLGFSGRMLGKDLINLSTGMLGEWSYSLDSAWLSLSSNKLLSSGFAGNLRLPLMEEGEAMPYQGLILPSVSLPGDFDISFKAIPKAVNISLLRAKILFDSLSEISVGRLGGKFQSPKVSLNGLVTFDIGNGDPGFAGDIMNAINDLRQALVDAGLEDLIPSLNMDGIAFQGMKIDLDAPDKFQIGSILPQNLSLKFLGLNSEIGSLTFGDISLPDLDSMKIKRPTLADIRNFRPRKFGFNLEMVKEILGAAAPKVEFSMVINEEQTTENKTRFKFGGFHMKFSKPDISFDCNQNVEPISLNPASRFSGNIEAGTALKIGHFTLLPTNITADDGNGTISGSGTVNVPILGPFQRLGVTFDNIVVGEDGRIVSGEVLTGGPNLFNSPDLPGLLATVGEKAVSGLNSVVQLPVVLGAKADGKVDRDQGLILMGLVFYPNEAKAQGKVVVPLGNDKFAEFKVEGLTLVPGGIANYDLRVGLAADFDFQPVSTLNPLVFKAYNQSDLSGSFIELDCKGFVQFNLEGAYSFDKTTIISLDNPEGPVTARFSMNTQQWGEFIGQMWGLGRFELTQLPGFTFAADSALIDFSRERNMSGVVYPEAYETGATSERPNLWRGFYIKELGVTLPEELAFSNTGARPGFQGYNLLVDSLGFSGDLAGSKLVDGEVDGWAFSLDSIALQIRTNTLAAGAIGGNIGLPLLDQPLPYAGSLTQMPKGGYKMGLHPAENTRLEVTALKTYLELADSALITLEPDTLQAKRPYRAYADLYGKIGFSVTNEDLHNPAFTGQTAQDALTLVEETLGIPFKFEPPAIVFRGLKINHPSLPDTSSFGLDGFDVEGSISIGDFEVSLDQLNIREVANMDFKGVKLPSVGFDLDLSLPAFNIDLKLWAKKTKNALGKDKYDFGKFELNFELPKFNCEGNCVEPEDKTVARNAVQVGDKIKAGGFEIEVTEVGSPNKGTVRMRFLSSTLNVEFGDIGLNASGELVQGTIRTVKNSALFAQDLIQVGLPGSEPIQLPLLDQANAALNDFTQLPFSLKEKIQENIWKDFDLPFDFIVVGVRFTPQGGRLDAVISIEPGDAQDFSLQLGVSGLCLSPEGVAFDQLKVYLLKEISLDDWELPLTFLPGNAETDGGSYVELGCTGVKKFHMQAKYAFDPDKLVPVQQGKDRVEATFTFESEKWGQFLASASIDSFMIAGLEDVIFRVDSAYIDYSDTKNPGGFPNDYFAGLPNPPQPKITDINKAPVAGAPAQPSVTNALWRGFFLKEVMVALPESFSLENGGRITARGNNMIFDRGNGFSGRLSAQNLVKLKGENGAGPTGDLGGWAFSIEELVVKIKYNSLDTFGLHGKIHVPVTSQEDAIAYQASISIDADKKPVAQFALKDIGGTYTVPFLQQAKMKITDNSIVGIKYDNGGFEPYSDVSGSFTFVMDKPEFKLELLAFENFKINDYDMPKLPPRNSNVRVSASAKVKTGGLDRISFKAFKFKGISLPSSSPSTGSSGPPSGNNNAVVEGDGGSGSGNTAGQGDNISGKNEKMGGFPINITSINFSSIEEGKESLKRLSIGVSVNFTSEKSGGGIAGKANLAVVGKLNIDKLLSEPWKSVAFKRLDLGTIEISADLGNIQLYGGLVIIDKDPVYGTGFKGLLDLTIKPTLRVEAMAQFGVTNYQPTSEANLAGGVAGPVDYRYFFADAKATFFPGVGFAGVAIYGFGGGVFYNMAKQPIDAAVAAKQFTINETGDPLASTTGNAGVSQTPKQAPLPNPMEGAGTATLDPRLEPGVSLSGSKYYPYNGILGLKATVIAGLQNPQVLNAEATFGIELNYQTMGIRKLYFEGKAFLLCSSILEKEDASIKASLEIEMDFNNKRVVGAMDFSVNTPVMKGGGSGAMMFSFASNESGNPLDNPWYIHIGTPQKPITITYQISDDIQLGSISAYFMAGHNLPEPKPLHEIHPGFGSRSNERKAGDKGAAVFSNGRGVAFGAALNVPKKEYKFLMFTTTVAAGIGFDVNMSQYTNITCGGKPLGLEGWYLKGRVYAYFEGKVDVDVDVFFYEGRVNLVTLGVFADLSVELPNPTWMKGRARANASILDGLLSFDVNVEVEIGERCPDFANASPIAGISIITDFQPTDNANAIPVYFEPRAAFSKKVNPNRYAVGSYDQRHITVKVLDDEGKEETRIFAPYIKLFELRKGSATGELVATSVNLDNNASAISLLPRNMLEARTRYYTRLEIGWLENQGGRWTDAMDGSKQVVEERHAAFTTGDLPDKIVKQMLSYHAPGDRQRNFHQNFADARIEFKQSGFGYLFDRCKDVTKDGKKVNVCYTYEVRLTNLRTKKTQVVPITEYPRSGVNFDRYELQWKTVSLSNYKIPVYVKVTSQGTEIKFNGLNNPGVLETNSIYKLEIVGVPERRADDNLVAGTQNVAVAAPISGISRVKTSLKAQTTDPTKELKILYEYHFKTSKYNSLEEKLAKMTYAGRRDGVRRSDISHPNLDTRYSVPIQVNEPDDYHLYVSDEGFDQFDQERLRKNLKFNHNDVENRHPFETPLYYSMIPDDVNGRTTYSYTHYNEAWNFSNSYDYEIWKKIGTESQGVFHERFQLKNITDKVFEKYWDTPGYGMMIQFPSNPGNDLLTDAEIRSGIPADNRCYYCNTDGYSGYAWSMSVTMSRRRVMMNQWAFMNFLKTRGDTWESKFGDKYQQSYRSVEKAVETVVEWFEDVVNWVADAVSSFWGWITGKKKVVTREKRRRIEIRYETVWEPFQKLIPGKYINRRFKTGLAYYRLNPRDVYYTYWMNNYMSPSGSYPLNYYYQYSNGISHTPFRKRLTDITFHIHFYQPNRWTQMGETAPAWGRFTLLRMKER